MKLRDQLIIILLLLGNATGRISGQTPFPEEGIASTSDYLVAYPFADRTVVFDLSDTGVHKPVIWGLDLAWLSEDNIRRGIAFMGADRVDVVRSSFMPTEPLKEGALQGDALTNTNLRIDIINRRLDKRTEVALNCDHPSVHSFFSGNAENWAQLIAITTQMHQDAGRTVVSVSPFNEPDYGWGQGTLSDFFNIAGELKKNPDFDSIRISGGNTLNTDQALPWYNQLKSRLDEGNTHQLAGSFDHYAAFYEAVRANGHHATNDELHNVMEAMVGVEYGLQTGIWWGTAELARGEFVKASDGRRLAYAEHRPNWTAASVYRNPGGEVKAFVGSSERQAATTTYLFISKDREVFFDGHGPQREYQVEIPGGTGYQQGQTNAEKMVTITWGDDIPPVIQGTYLLVNRNSGKVMEIAGGSSSAGAYVIQANPTDAAWQQWKVTPVDPRVGGDFSYFTIEAVNSGKVLDVYNWSLDNGGNIIVWDDHKGVNQQWFLEYAEEDWFFIRSRHSALCLEVADSGNSPGARIQQREKNGDTNQQWRFLNLDAPVEFEAPVAPENLIATAHAESIYLEWSASPEEDVSGYTVFRSESAEGPYNTIARNVRTTSFVDNSRTTAGQYFYKIKAVDKSLNSSEYSIEVTATTTGDSALVAHFPFEGNTLDSSINLNHSAPYRNIVFIEGIAGTQSLALNGQDHFLQLPYHLANQQEITVATWVYWKGGTPWQRIFDFGNNQNESMYLTPGMRFAIKNGGNEQRLNAPALPTGEWSHVAISLSPAGARMYVNGKKIDESKEITIKPADFHPILNYIGRGQTPVPFFNGLIDDFRVYNYPLPDDEIAALVSAVSVNQYEIHTGGRLRLNIYPVPAKHILNYRIYTEKGNHSTTLGIFTVYGRMVLREEIKNRNKGKINISNLPSGIYWVGLTNGQKMITKKLIIHP
jgi:hypothetical protein